VILLDVLYKEIISVEGVLENEYSLGTLYTFSSKLCMENRFVVWHSYTRRENQYKRNLKLLPTFSSKIFNTLSNYKKLLICM